MQTILIVIHLMVVVALVGVVLLQRSEGGALGVGGGGGFLTGRGQANALTRATAVLAALFFATSLSLTILAGFNRSSKSILDTPPATTEPGGQAPGQSGQSPAPGGTLFDQLKRQQDQAPAEPAPAPAAQAPAAPAPAAPAPSAPAPAAPAPSEAPKP
jgi:preprotein translocase subunit SecG